MKSTSLLNRLGLILMFSILAPTSTTAQSIVSLEDTVIANDSNSFNQALPGASRYDVHDALCEATRRGYIHFVTALPQDSSNSSSYCSFDDLGFRFTAPQLAAYLGNTRLLELFLSHGYPVNRIDQDQTLVSAAALGGQIESIDYLLENGGQLLVEGEYSSPSAIVSAALGGQAETVRDMLSRGQSIESSDGQLTPLMAAVLGGHESLVTELISIGANLDAGDEFNNVLIYALLIRKTTWDETLAAQASMLRLIGVNQRPTRLIEAASYQAIDDGHPHIRILLEAKNLDLNAPSYRYDEATVGEALLAEAVDKDFVVAVDLLLERGVTFSQEILEFSIDDNKTMVALRLISEGVPDLQGENRGLLHEAARSGNTSIVRALIKAGADVNAVVDEETAFMLAMERAGRHTSVSMSPSNMWESMALRSHLNKTRDYLGTMQTLLAAGAKTPDTILKQLPDSFVEGLRNILQVLRARDYITFFDAYLQPDSRQAWLSTTGATSTAGLVASPEFEDLLFHYLVAVQIQLQAAISTAEIWSSGGEGLGIPETRFFYTTGGTERLSDVQNLADVDGLVFRDFAERFLGTAVVFGETPRLFIPPEMLTSRALFPHQMQNDRERGQAMMVWISLYQQAGFPERAIALLEEITTELRTSNKKGSSNAILLSVLAQLYLQTGELTKAEQLASESIASLEGDDFAPMNWSATETLMMSALMKGEPDSTRAFADQMETLLVEAIAMIRKEVDDRSSRAMFMGRITQSYANLGQVLTQLGEYEHARELLEGVRNDMQGYEGANGSNSIQLTMTLGSLYAVTGQVESAESIYHESEQLLKQVAADYSDQMVWVKSNLAALAGQQADVTTAASRYDDALAVAQEIWSQDDPQYALLQAQAAMIYFANGETHKARSMLIRADRTLAGTQNQIYSQVGLANVFTEIDPVAAIRYADTAIDLARRHHGENHPTIVTMLAVKAGVLQRSGNREEAITTWEEVLDRAEAQRNRFHNEFDRRAYLTQLRVYYQALANLYIESGNTLAAIQTLERQKAKSLLELLANQDIVSADPDVSNVLKELNSIDNRLLAMNVTGDELRGMPLAIARPESEAREQIEDQRHEVLQQLRQLNLGFASMREVNSIDMTEFQGSLGEDTAVLVLSEGISLRDPTAKSAKVFLMSRDDVSVHEITGELPVRSLVDQLKLPQDLDRLQRDAGQVYKAIFEPLQTQLAGISTLLVVADGLWNFLPLAALHDGRNYLVERYRLVSIPSISVYSYLSDQQPGRSEGFFALGNPVSPLGALPGAENEVQIISSMFSDSEIHLEMDATESQLKTLPSSPGVLHIASHGVFDLDQPERSYLSLTADARNDGFLEVHEAYSLNLADTNLVVLSACETAVGQISGGDVISLVRPFLVSGASNVVASLWQVDDLGTASLMDLFYQQYLANGGDPSSALREAQLQMIASGNLAHPFYWSAFQAYGSK